MRIKFLPLLLLLIAAVAGLTSCKKEHSLELGFAEGEIQIDDDGNCIPAEQFGRYEVATAINPDSNYLEITVDITKIGKYEIITDTVNGLYFEDAGSIFELGVITLKLEGHGTPLAAGEFFYRVRIGDIECSVPLIIQPEGTYTPAIFTFNGSPDNCSNAQVFGEYINGVAVTSSTHYVVLNINVIKVGFYSVTTTANGVTFSSGGMLTTLGPQTLVLTAQGTPNAGGTVQVPVSSSMGGCSFELVIVNQAEFQLDCTKAVFTGMFVAGLALNSNYSVVIPVNVTQTGIYSITSGPVNGVTLRASGDFTTTGNNTITFSLTGTPAAQGEFTYPIVWKQASCNIKIKYLPVGTRWELFMENVYYSGSQGRLDYNEYPDNNGNVGFSSLRFRGYQLNNDPPEIDISINSNGVALVTGDVMHTNIYNEFFPAFNLDFLTHTYTAFIGQPVNITFNIIYHDRATRTFLCRFSGSVYKSPAPNDIKNITQGMFLASY